MSYIEQLKASKLVPDLLEARNLLLAETDYWALSDRTMTQEQIDYRQALRDVPQQEGFPANITWPTKP
jgi:hypothetical protein